MWKKAALAGIAAFVVLQAVRPAIPALPVTAEVQAPEDVKRILNKGCYSCHSDERRLSWFDEVVPAYWLVRHDVLAARRHLNFSTLGSKPASAQGASLFEAVNMIQLGAMPLAPFAKLHPEARLSAEEVASVKRYLAPWSVAPEPPSGDAPPATAVPLATVQPEYNGLAFDSTFASWKTISTTDRGDNNSFRFILGNDIAVKAAQAGTISPWPDGARFAKIAWQQEAGLDGLIHPGKFIQVEIMIKEASRYKDTEGWGWGRWRGADLKPYGSDASFVHECTGCHQPMSANDFVYSLPISSAKAPREDTLNPRAAALPASLPYQPLAWTAITMYVDPKAHTMATLYGNDVARNAIKKAPAYPEGSVLALVTWTQRDDPHWFGARIPDSPQSVEFVRITGQATEYRRFTGEGLREDTTVEPRSSFLLGLTPAWLP